MRVVASSGNSRDFRQVELDRHCEMVSRFVACIREAGKASRTLTLILRSASSCPAKALVVMKDELVGGAVRARAILARLEPAEDLRELFAGLSELAPREHAGELIRWARNPRLLDAHEQVTYGEMMCWSGDPMRRDADKRNALALFDEGSSVRVRHGRLAFEALWAVSSAVPERRLLGAATLKPSGAYQPSAETPVTVLRSSPQGWPLVRH
jgi:hypothetical protein